MPRPFSATVSASLLVLLAALQPGCKAKTAGGGSGGAGGAATASSTGSGTTSSSGTGGAGTGGAGTGGVGTSGTGASSSGAGGSSSSSSATGTGGTTTSSTGAATTTSSSGGSCGSVSCTNPPPHCYNPQGSCQGNVCVYTPAPAGSACSVGSCDGAGNCVTPCSPSACQSPPVCQTTPGFCGVGPGGGTCSYTKHTNGDACPGGACMFGDCWTCSALCIPPVCRLPATSCTGLLCQHPNAPVGTPCPAGTCKSDGTCGP